MCPRCWRGWAVADRAPPHVWRWEDDVVAFHLFRAGTDEAGLAGVERALGISPAAMRMRIANFQALAGGGGLANASAQSRAVFEKYRGTPDVELRGMALRILRGGAATANEQQATPDAAKKVKLPPLVHLVCGWPLILVAIGGAIGGALGGLAYGVGLIVYRKTRSLQTTFLASLGLGGAAAILWYLVVSAIRG